ncbi:MAG: hypothetical protein V2B20_28480 [Pseudomonadota bacterium]
MKWIFLFIILTFYVSFPVWALAIDPGTVTGTLIIDQDEIVLKHAYAHLHDNAEGWLDWSEEMRILLTDREVSQKALAGLNPVFTLSEMLKQDKLRGVLLRFNPAAPNTVVITVLYPPKAPCESLANKLLSDNGRSPIDRLMINDLRVSGAIKQHADGNKELGVPAEDYSARFSAPLFKELPVTSDLRGKKVLQSPQVVALLTKYAAMAKGDLKKVRQYSTDRSNREIDTNLSRMDEEAMPVIGQMAIEQEQRIKRGPLRLIVRGNKATLIVGPANGKSMMGFVKEEDIWKSEYGMAF